MLHAHIQPFKGPDADLEQLRSMYSHKLQRLIEDGAVRTVGAYRGEESSGTTRFCICLARLNGRSQTSLFLQKSSLSLHGIRRTTQSHGTYTSGKSGLQVLYGGLGQCL